MGCFTSTYRSSHPINVLTTNVPPDVQVSMTNTVPDPLTVKLEPGLEKALVRAIESVAKQTNGTIVIQPTNATPTIVTIQVTNPMALPDTFTFRPDTNTAQLLHDIKNKKSGVTDLLLGSALTLLGSLVVLGIGKYSEKRRSTNILLAIRREIEALRKVYATNLRSILNQVPADGIFPERASLTVNWFAVYEGNTEYLGRFDPETAQKLILAHASLKSLIESYRLNNTLLDQWGVVSQSYQPAQGTFGQEMTPPERIIYKLLQLRLPEIKAADTTMENNVNDLLAHLDQKGIN